MNSIYIMGRNVISVVGKGPKTKHRLHCEGFVVGADVVSVMIMAATMVADTLNYKRVYYTSLN